VVVEREKVRVRKEERTTFLVRLLLAVRRGGWKRKCGVRRRVVVVFRIYLVSSKYQTNLSLSLSLLSPLDQFSLSVDRAELS